MPAQPISLSVVLPAFEEAQRIGASLREIGEYLAGQSYASEVIVVDDGSADGTFDTVSMMAESFPVPMTVGRYEPNRGKGHALKVAFALTQGDRILFSDADLSTPIEETAGLLAALSEPGISIAIGSRKMAGANIEVHQPYWRESMGKIFTRLAQTLVPGISDTTCGFKAFDGQVGRDLFARARIDDWSFDAEILLLAALGGHAVREVPVRWHDEAGTKVRVFRDALFALSGLTRIRWNATRGVYAAMHPIDVEVDTRCYGYPTATDDAVAT